MKKIIGIIGTRSRNLHNDYIIVEGVFLSIYKEGDWIVSGGCSKGGDRFAEVISKDFGIPILIFPPDYKQYGRSAPFIRNKKIAEFSNKALIACVNEPRTGGTENTIMHFRKIHPSGKLILC
uniref:DNA recombination-mediator protein A n=1 Tax=viral metagenome TaxID=1070528 RepID=A0A6H1ZEF6_9ZZZZ